MGSFSRDNKKGEEKEQKKEKGKQNEKRKEKKPEIFWEAFQGIIKRGKKKRERRRKGSTRKKERKNNLCYKGQILFLRNFLESFSNWVWEGFKVQWIIYY